MTEVNLRVADQSGFPKKYNRQCWYSVFNGTYYWRRFVLGYGIGEFEGDVKIDNLKMTEIFQEVTNRAMALSRPKSAIALIEWKKPRDVRPRLKSILKAHNPGVVLIVCRNDEVVDRVTKDLNPDWSGLK
jgi:hypothetical protein